MKYTTVTSDMEVDGALTAYLGALEQAKAEAQEALQENQKQGQKLAQVIAALSRKIGEVKQLLGV